MKVTPGSTDVVTYMALVLASDGSDATGLTVTDFDLQYVRSGATPAAKVDASALGATNSAHADNSAIEVDATDQPGLYRVDWPDAAFAANAREVILTLKHASCRAAHLRVELETIQGGDNFARLGAPAGASVSADIAAVKAQTAAIETDTQDIQNRLPAALTGDGNIKADTLRVGGTLQTAGDIPARLPAALTADGNIKADTLRVGGTLQTAGDIPARLPAALTAGGNMKSDALAISGSTAGADALEESTEAIAYGTVDGTGATTTVFLSSALTPDSAVNDQFNGRVLIFKSDTTTAALRGQATTISDYAHTSAEVGTFTVVALTTAPASGDTFVIL